MRRRFALFLISTIVPGALLMVACHNHRQPERVNAAYVIADSFTLSGAASLSEFQTMRNRGDSILLALDKESNILRYYKKQNGSKFYEFANGHAITPRNRKYLHSFETISPDTIIAADYAGHLYFYDSSARLLDSLTFAHPARLLKNRYVFAFCSIYPLVCVGDTIIALIHNRELQDEKLYYSEPGLMELVVKGSRAVNVRQYLKKPADLRNYYSNLFSWCFVNNRAFMLTPCFDTLYVYDRAARKEDKIPINNPDFQLPTVFDHRVTGTAAYDSYQLRHELSNFRYTAIMHNSNTGHFIIFYHRPAKKTTGRLPSFRDQPLCALVLNERFEIQRIVEFNTLYFAEVNFFIFSGRGICMPLFKNKSDFETTRYHIFDL